MNYSPSYFLRILISFMACSFAQTALGSTRLCSDLFPAVLGSASNPKSTVSADFLQASHQFSAATLTQASKSTSASEIKDTFSKLTRIAKEHQLSQSEFQRWMEQSKLTYIREIFLSSNTDDKLIMLDHQIIKNMDDIAIQMKLSSMPYFFDPKKFIEQLQSKEQLRWNGTESFTSQMFNTPQDTVLKYIEAIQDSSEYPVIRAAFDRKPGPGVTVAFYPSQDSDFFHVIFEYITENKERKYLWSLQKVDTLSDPTFLIPTPDLKSIAYASLERDTLDTKFILPHHMSLFPHSYFFTFYSPDTKTLSLAMIIRTSSNASMRWISLIPCLDKEKPLTLPHLNQKELHELQSQLTKSFPILSSKFDRVFYNEKTKSFLFFLTETQIHNYDPTSEETENNKILYYVFQSSALSENNFGFLGEIHLPKSMLDPKYDYTFAKDGSFLTLTIRPRTSSYFAAPEIEGSTIQTHYFLFNDQFQLGLSKKDRP
jgi:hypothetical protein